MRVHEKYSTLPAEDRSVHIINICAIEDVGYLPSEGTVSAGGRGRAGGPRTCAAPGEGRAGTAARAGGARSRTWGPAAGTHAVCALRGAPDRPDPGLRVQARGRLAPGGASQPERTAGALGGTLPSRWCRFGQPRWGRGGAASPGEGGGL